MAALAVLAAWPDAAAFEVIFACQTVLSTVVLLIVLLDR